MCAVWRGGAVARGVMEKKPRASASGPDPAKRLIMPPEEGAGPRAAATACERLLGASDAIVFSVHAKIAGESNTV